MLCSSGTQHNLCLHRIGHNTSHYIHQCSCTYTHRLQDRLCTLLQTDSWPPVMIGTPSRHRVNTSRCHWCYSQTHSTHSHTACTLPRCSLACKHTYTSSDQPKSLWTCWREGEWPWHHRLCCTPPYTQAPGAPPHTLYMWRSRSWGPRMYGMVAS